MGLWAEVLGAHRPCWAISLPACTWGFPTRAFVPFAFLESGDPIHVLI